MPLSKIQTDILREIVQPDPDRLDSYQTHAGQLRGHWPSSAEITAAMLERYKRYNRKRNRDLKP